MGLIQELDYFAEYCKLLNKIKRMSDRNCKRIVKSVDTLQNAMENAGY